jgi:hypothetical protein
MQTPSSQKLFIVRNKFAPYYVHRDIVEFNGFQITSEVNDARRFTMPEANTWIHDQAKPQHWIVEYAPLREGVTA